MWPELFLMDHLVVERLIDLARNQEGECEVSPEEDRHLVDCPECLGKLVEYVKRFHEN
jgi:hypothetical protein